MEALNKSSNTSCVNTIPSHVENLLNNFKMKNETETNNYNPMLNLKLNQSHSQSQTQSQSQSHSQSQPQPYALSHPASKPNNHVQTSNTDSLINTKLGQEVISQMESKKISNLLQDFIIKNKLTPQEVSNFYSVLAKVKNSLPEDNNVLMSWHNDKLKVEVTDKASLSKTESEDQVTNSNVSKTMWGLVIFAVILVLLVLIFIVMK